MFFKKFFTLLLVIQMSVLMAERSDKKSTATKEALAVIPAVPEIKLDFNGVPDEAFWQNALTVRPKLPHRQNYLQSKAETLVHFCSDISNLYIGIVCYEPDEVTVNNAVTLPWKSDSVEIFIANAAHPAWYRQIVIGANGGKFSQMIHESQWQGKAAVSKNMWSAEIVVPLDKLGKVSGGDLRMNILRTRRSVKEIITYQLLKARALEVESFAPAAMPGALDMLHHAPWTFQTTSRSAGVAYETAAPAESCFFYRQQGAQQWLRSNGRSTADKLVHSCVIENLLPDTVYEYYVPGMKKTGSFKTLCEKNQDFSAVIVPDLHCRAFELANIIKRHDVQQSDFLVLLGDQLAASLAREYHYDGYLNTVIANWQKPFYVAVGNHEGRGEAADSFYDLFANGRKAGFFAFCHKKVSFVILDCDRDEDMSDEYKQQQIEFLKKYTASDEFKNAQYRVLLLHVPISFFWRRWGKENFEIFSALSQEVQQSFDLALSGHIHQYTYCLAGDKTITSQEPTIHGMKAERKLPFPEFTAPELATVMLKKSNNSLQVNIFDQHSKLIENYSVKPKR